MLLGKIGHSSIVCRLARLAAHRGVGLRKKASHPGPFGVLDTRTPKKHPLPAYSQPKTLILVVWSPLLDEAGRPPETHSIFPAHTPFLTRLISLKPLAVQCTTWHWQVSRSSANRRLWGTSPAAPPGQSVAIYSVFISKPPQVPSLIQHRKRTRSIFSALPRSILFCHDEATRVVRW